MISIRRVASAVVLTVLALGSTARGAERTLEDAVQTTLTEVRNRETDIGADLVRSSREARLLRRGREKLEDALALHAEGKWKPAGLAFAKGLGKLHKAFEDAADPAGEQAIDGITEELEQFCTEQLAELAPQVDALPDSSIAKKARKNQGKAESLLDKATRLTKFHDRVPLLLGAYAFMGKLARKLEKAQELASSQLEKAIGKRIPKDLTPNRQYGIRWWVNDQLASAGYRTNEHPSKLTWRILKQQVAHYAEVNGPDEPCIWELVSDPWENGEMYISVIWTCPGDTTHRVRLRIYLVQE